MSAFILMNLPEEEGESPSSSGITGSQSAAAVLQRDAYRSVVVGRIPEGTTPTLALVIADDDGEDLTLDDLAFAKLTLKVHGTEEIINARDEVDVKGAAEIYGANPTKLKITFVMTPEDTPVIGTGARETHEALFHWRLGESLEDKHQVLHTVRKI